MKFTEILVLFLIATCLGERVFPSFEQYAAAFNKTYATAEELAERRAIYEGKIEQLKLITDYEPAVNNMTDWRPAEIKGRSNLKQLPEILKTARPALQASRLGLTLPNSLDYRNYNGQNYVTSIKDQGYCGACWAFAAAAMAESKLRIEGRFTTIDLDLSEQYLLSCTQDSTCTGGYLEQVLKKSSIPAEVTYPYTPFSYQPTGICSAQGISVSQTFNSYYNLTDAQIRTMLMVSGPLAIAIASNNWQNYGSGIFSCQATDGVDHAVLLVGYTPDYWIVKNQWGTNFGLNGYIHISRTAGSNCRIGVAVHHYVGEGDSSNDAQFMKIIADGPSNSSASSGTNSGSTASRLHGVLLGSASLLLMLLLY